MVLKNENKPLRPHHHLHEAECVHPWAHPLHSQPYCCTLCGFGAPLCSARVAAVWYWWVWQPGPQELHGSPWPCCSRWSKHWPSCWDAWQEQRRAVGLDPAWRRITGVLYWVQHNALLWLSIPQLHLLKGDREVESSIICDHWCVQ